MFLGFKIEKPKREKKEQKTRASEALAGKVVESPTAAWWAVFSKNSNQEPKAKQSQILEQYVLCWTPKTNTKSY